MLLRMKTNEFMELLQAHPRKKLGFQYGEGMFLRKDYHITEVKSVQVAATDCGGRQDAWEETVIQLWESPKVASRAPQMRGLKAFQILSRVGGVQPLPGHSLLRFEYGNSRFHTSQLEVSGYRIEPEELILQLSPQYTTCKASDLCGVPEAEAPAEPACEPGSGCC